MDTVKLFKNGKRIIIKLPKSYDLIGEEAFISKVGDAIILLPKKGNWNSLFKSLSKFSDDFMLERNQPQIELIKIE